MYVLVAVLSTWSTTVCLVSRLIFGVSRSLADRQSRELKTPTFFTTMASNSNQDYGVSSARWNDTEQGKKELAEVDSRGVSPSEHNVVATETLARKLSARQVQMIAIGGEYTMAYFLAVHSRSALTRKQVQLALVCSWARERVWLQVVRHLC